MHVVRTATEPPARLFSCDQALCITGGDYGLLTDLVHEFMKEAPELLSAMAAAFERGEAAGLRRYVHTLKGAVQIFGAERLAAVARRIEAAPERADRESIATVKNLTEALCAELLAFLEARS